MLIYIITNRWYRASNIFKVGMHRLDSIDTLVKQYIGRYMPEVDVVAKYIVEDAISMENIIHNRLLKNKSIDRIRGEWFQGKDKDIINVVKNAISECSREDNVIRTKGRSYHPSCESNASLARIGKELNIINPYSMSSDRWRDMQIYLIKNRDRITDGVEYIYVGQDNYQLAKVMEDLSILPFKGITRKDLVSIISKGKYTKRMLDLMTIPNLKEVAKNREVHVPSRTKKADIVKLLSK